ncbi:MAG: T9SS type A sorting domain-containing protein, partial [Bacteroidota bacterium]
LADGSNEVNNYATLNYTTANAPLVVGLSGNPTLTDVNRWQPLVLDFTVDANGEVVPGNTPGFLSPEWGQVTPFALTPDDLTIFERDGVDYWVYHDPGAPPQLELGTGAGGSRDYIWNFALVAVWSSHLDPDNETMIDISPASRGNTPVSEFPTTAEEYVEFYDLLNGGITGSQGHAINPFTGEVYEPQLVRMGDYGRVLAEFWADGPRSETPPGHWFTIFNEVSDHEALVKRFGGTGDVMSDLAWDVHGYFLLGASFHDVAISVWGIKSWYDYIRPVSAIRSLASRGQSSDPNLPSYSPDGIMLIDGHIEVVQEGDELAGANNENVGKIKLNAWRGPAYVADAETDHAGVGWILADDWWPYQQPSFVTPPFAGYVSGHSTFSRAASEILTMFTGSEYFPGGIGEFSFTHDEYLAFENGPSTDITLQWATYRDASDETSLSRIWGGIHPPIDDIPGRLIGIDVANDVFAKASAIFEGVVTGTEDAAVPGAGFAVEVYPNPVGISRSFHLAIDQAQVHRELEVEVYNALGQQVYRDAIASPNQTVSLDERRVSPGVYLVRVTDGTTAVTRKLIVL